LSNVLRRLKSSFQTRLLDASYRLHSFSLRNRVVQEATPYQAQIIEDLKTEGVHVTTVDRLLSESARTAILHASEFIREPSTLGDPALWRMGDSSHDIHAAALLEKAPGAYLLGLETSILSLARLYIRQPVAYHGAVIRRSLVDGRDLGTRLWHQDAEDFNVLRMVIYLNDVTSGGGPFEYIPRNSGLNYGLFGNAPGPLTNERMKEVMPFDKWRRVMGSAGTVVLADTAKTFHHESMQTARERAVVMIGYTSQRPKARDVAMRHFPVESVKPALLRIVPEENHAHVFGWRRPAT
jgi:hypothetical protein